MDENDRMPDGGLRRFARRIRIYSRPWLGNADRHAVQTDAGDAPREAARDAEETLPWTNILKILICGTRDPDSPLSLLRGFEETLVRNVDSELVATWKSSVTRTVPSYQVVLTWKMLTCGAINMLAQFFLMGSGALPG
jgi:hypothetical protein